MCRKPIDTWLTCIGCGGEICYKCAGCDDYSEEEILERNPNKQTECQWCADYMEGTYKPDGDEDDNE
jgi:hypothetical protein